MRRRADGADPLASTAPFVDRLGLALAESRVCDSSGRRAWRDPRVEQAIVATPIRRLSARPSVACERLADPPVGEHVRSARATARTVFCAERARPLPRRPTSSITEVEKRDYASGCTRYCTHFIATASPGADVAADTRAAPGDRCGEPRVARPRRSGLPAVQRLVRGPGSALRCLAARTRSGGRGLVARRGRAAGGAGSARRRRAPGPRRPHRHRRPGGSRLELIDYKTGSAKEARRTPRRADRFRGHPTRLLRLARRRREPVAAARLLSRDGRDPRARGARARRRHGGVCVSRRGERPRRRPAAPAPEGPTLPPLGEGAACEPLRCAGPVPSRPLVARGRGGACGRRRRCARMSAPAFRVDGALVGPRRVLRRRLRSGAQLRRRGVRRVGQDLDAGLAHATRAARRRRPRTRSSPSRSPAPPPVRCASACTTGLPAYAAPHASHAERVAALVMRGIAPARAEALAPELADPCTAASSPPAGRSRSAPFTPGSRSCCGSPPMALLDRLGLAPEMELIEDLEDHRPAVDARLSRRVFSAIPPLRADYAAMTARPAAATQLGKWLAAAWWKRVEFEMADEASVLVESVDIGAVALARDRAFRASGGRRARCLLAGTGCAMSPDVLGRGAKTHQETAARLGAALASGDARRLFEDRVACGLHPTRTSRASLSKTLAALAETPGSAGPARTAGRAARRADRAPTHGSARPCPARRVRRLQARARLCRHGRSRTLRAGDPARRRALRLVPGAARRAHPPCPHRRVPGHQSAAMACPARAGCRPTPAPAAARAARARPASSSSAIRSRASIASAAPSRASSPRHPEFVRDGLEGSALACDHTRRNAPAVIARDQRRLRRGDGRGRIRGLSSAHDRGRDRSRRCDRGVAAPSARSSAPAVPTPNVAPTWRDTLTTPRLEPEVVLREREAATRRDAGSRRCSRAALRPARSSSSAASARPLRLVAAALERAHVAHSAVEDTTLASTPEAQDLIAVLDAVVSPAHRLSLARVLAQPAVWRQRRPTCSRCPRRPAAGDHDWWRALRGDDPPRRRRCCARANCCSAGARAAAQLPPHDLLDRIVPRG